MEIQKGCHLAMDGIKNVMDSFRISSPVILQGFMIIAHKLLA